MFFEPCIIIFAAFAFIAWSAKQLQIGRIARSPACDGYDMINLKFVLSLAGRATVILRSAKTVYIFICEMTAVFRNLCLSILYVRDESLAPQVWIFRHTPFRSGPNFRWVFLGPFERSFAMARGIFVAPFSRPFGFETRMGGIPFLLPDYVACEAKASRNVAFVFVAIFARLADGIMLFATKASRYSVRVLNTLLLPSQSIFYGAFGAEAITCVSLGKMAVLASFSGIVKAITHCLRGFSFSDSPHRSPLAFFNAVDCNASLVKGQLQCFSMH